MNYNSQIRQRAWRIIKGNPMPFLIAGALFAAISHFANSLDTVLTAPSGKLIIYRGAAMLSGILAMLLMQTINAFLNASRACFYYRAYNRGFPQLEDIAYPIAHNDSAKAFFKVMVAYWVIMIAMCFAAVLSVFLIWFLAPVILMLGIVIMNQVWYLFAANPYYPTEYYFKAAYNYFGRYIFQYILFIIITAIIPGLLIGLTALISEFLAGIGSAVLNVYVGVAGAGFIDRLIPDRWFSGEAVF